VPASTSERYGIKSFMAIALPPKTRMAWEFGIQQCSDARVWTHDEEVQFQEIARRLTDGLTSMLMQRDLRESEAKYRRIVDTANEGILTLDDHEKITFINAHMAKMLGYTRNELEGHRASEFLLKEDLSDHRQRLINRHNKLSETYERRLVRKDGSLMWALISAAPIFDGARFHGTLSMITDISERKQLEEKYRDSEEKFSRAFHAAPTLMAITRPDDGTIVEINESFSRFFGYTREECIGLNTSELNMWADPKQRDRAVKQLKETGSAMFMPVDLRTKSGEIRSVIDSLLYITIKNEKYLLSVATDVTESKRAEEALKRYSDTLEETVEQRTNELRFARDAAEAASKAKSLFLANMSHELRTPLNAILGFSQLMQQDTGLTPTQYENLNIINNSGEHLLKLINDVLEIAKIEAGKLQLEIAPFDLHNLVRDVADMMQLRAQQKGLQLELDQSSGFPRYIKGDEARIRQILVNLVSNAVKFTDKGSVTIRLDTKENAQQHLVIVVEDTGPGISEEDKQLLFKPFVQLREGVSHGGTGLGLSIIRQFVQLMNGTVDLESTPGKGSKFCVQLPLEHAEKTEIIQLGEENQGDVTGLAPGQPAYRILIAEDQHDNQLLLSKLMSDIGLPVRIANNGKECVQLFQEWHPDLIWMDRRMPVMDGVEATRRIRGLKGGKKVKIVAVTASAFKEQQPELLVAGMDDYISKPFQFNEIYDSLSRQLGVKFTYRNDTHETQAAPAPLTSQKLAAISEEIRNDLRNAIESLDRERIDTTIDHINAVDGELARTLLKRIDEFDYPGILDALNRVDGE
ncbi:MAG: PAS domain S-box protein, partial [Candidatus Thiodiazotropha sp.]